MATQICAEINARERGGVGRGAGLFWATTATGKSVFAGASTTVAAASFLLFKCDASFFKTFGAFVLWTATVSSVFASVVFPATCALWGPEARRVGENDGDARRRRRRRS